MERETHIVTVMLQQTYFQDFSTQQHDFLKEISFKIHATLVFPFYLDHLSTANGVLIVMIYMEGSQRSVEVNDSCIHSLSINLLTRFVSVCCVSKFSHLTFCSFKVQHETALDSHCLAGGCHGC